LTVKKTSRKPRTDSPIPFGEAPRAFFTRFPRRYTGKRIVKRSFFALCVRIAALLLLCAALTLTLVLTVSTTMVRLTSPSVLTVGDLSAPLDYDCILVLGAGVRDDGTPSDMLYDRVKTACSAYHALGGDVPLIMSGDHTGDYNEVGVMKALAVEMEVYSADVFLDHEGYSTYESLYRARYVFGAKKILVVTQEYHLHRALYIARELGMEAEGISADLRPYRLQTRYNAREHLARFKDFFTAAKGEYDGHLDPPVDLNGNGDDT
jgi:vancomycin permeability regulator SanA